MLKKGKCVYFITLKGNKGEKQMKEIEFKAYLKYLCQWYQDHDGPEYQDMIPACFKEFLTNEYLEGETK